MPFTCLVAAGLFFSTMHAGAADDYSQWSQTSRVYLNTTPDGANVNAGVTDFPLLVRLDGGNFDFSEALGRGQDIRFSKAGGLLHLPYQIERWDSAGRVAEIWVKVDVEGDSKDQFFNMHWGRPGALDSSNGKAVFDTAAGFTAVWHLGGSGARANSVAGGNPAAPNLYDGDESRPGIIGMADSLDGGPSGDFLDLGDGYSRFASGFTYSVWANATAPLNYAKLLDLGNGAGIDNITLFRVETTDDLAFRVINNTTASPRVVAPSAHTTGVWQHFAVTVTGRVASIFRNGDLIATDTMDVGISVVNRTLNLIGKSNWPNNDCFRGKLDEPVLSRVARTPEWIRLSHANQRLGQTMVSFQRQIHCQSVFSVPGDTSVPERGSLLLTGTADCATAYAWSLVSGPGPRILDPEVKVLQLFIPRVSGDTALVYRFTARFPDGERSREVRVSVKEAIPDPRFTIPASLVWNGRDSLAIRPLLSNLSAVKASRDSILHYQWTLSGLPSDTTWIGNGLLLRRPGGEGIIEVGLCLHNGGAIACDSTLVTVNNTATGSPRRLRPTIGQSEGGRRPWVGRDAKGKKVPSGSKVRAFPESPAPDCQRR